MIGWRHAPSQAKLLQNSEENEVRHYPKGKKRSSKKMCVTHGGASYQPLCLMRYEGHDILKRCVRLTADFAQSQGWLPTVDELF